MWAISSDGDPSSSELACHPNCKGMRRRVNLCCGLTQAASSYPAYHTSEDRARYVNFAQLQLETRAVLATLLAVAR
jgi:hypothetical protein